MIRRFDESAEFAIEAAAIIAAELRNHAAAGWFSLALAGGATPAPVYRQLSEIWQRQPLPWRRALLVPGDERLLPNNDDGRNDRMIRDNLLAGLPDAAAAFLPLLAPSPPVASERVALAAENRLRASWFGELTPTGMPCFSLILLGLGTDGHTASIFADSPALAATDRWIMAVPAPVAAEPKVPRLTLTAPVIRAAKRVIFLVSGPEKVALAEQLLATPDSLLPAARVRAPAACDWLLAR